MQRTTVLHRWAIHALALLVVCCFMVEMAAAAETSGRYYQFGLRAFTPPGKHEAETVVFVQVDFGTRETCEARLAAIPKHKEEEEVEAWCSSESASAKLPYHGVFRNRITGKTIHVESEYIETCTSFVETTTGSQAANNKIEMTTECQAR